METPTFRAVKRQGYLSRHFAVSRQNVPYPRVETRLYLSLRKPQLFRFSLLEITRAQHTKHSTQHTRFSGNIVCQGVQTASADIFVKNSGAEAVNED